MDPILRVKPRRKLRYGIIGLGGAAETQLRSLAHMQDEVRVLGLADPTEAAMRDKAQRYELSEASQFTDYTRMLSDLELDAVGVCTPNHMHAPVTIAALEAGVHVLVEKPMALSSVEAEQMLATAQRVNRKLVVGFQYRFDPATQFLKQAADEGRLGTVHFVRAQWLRRRGIPNWGVFVQRELQGGGPLIDLGVHMLEMVHYLIGEPRPVAAVGKTATYIGHRPSKVKSVWSGWDYECHNIEDLAIGHVRFDNGAVVHIETMFAGHIEDDVMDFHVMGEKGGGSWAKPRLFTDEHGHMVNVEPGWLPHADHQGRFDLKMRDFVDHVLHDKPTLNRPEDGLMVQRMVDAIYKSAAEGGREVLCGEEG